MGTSPALLLFRKLNPTPTTGINWLSRHTSVTGGVGPNGDLPRGL